MYNIEEILRLPRLGKDDSFTFGCNRCGSCCHNRDDVLLSPLDLFKIARYMNQTIHDILISYCEVYEGKDSKLPVVRIKPREYRLTCPFANKGGCGIHPVKPAVCALFPLGRMTNEETKEFTYFVQPVTCGNKTQTQTVRQWLDGFSMSDEEEFTILWHQKIAEISTILRGIYSKLTFIHEPINSVVMLKLYVLYDMQKDFLPQFAANCEEVLRIVGMIANEATAFEVKANA